MKTIQEIFSSLKNSDSMWIDGICSAEVEDKSAELLHLKGADISTLANGGELNRDHAKLKDGGFSTVVGKCVFAKKIYKADDCSSKRELKYWNKIELPFIYGIFRLADGSGHKEAQEAAAIIRDAFKSGDEHLAFFSVDGSTIEKDGDNLKHTIVNSMALTLRPCNSACEAGLLSDPVIGYIYSEDEESASVSVSEESVSDSDSLSLDEISIELSKNEPIWNNLQKMAIRDVTEHPGFQKWFEGSKIVDPKGNPMIVYHGTKHPKEFNKFNRTDDLGYHFGNVSQAHDFVQDPKNINRPNSKNSLNGIALHGRIKPVYLSIKNPLRLEDHNHHLDQIHDALDSKNIPYVDNQQKNLIMNSRTGGYDSLLPWKVLREEAIKRLQAAGHDGIVYLNQEEGEKPADSYIALYPHQIKSIFANDFDVNNESIAKSLEAGNGNAAPSTLTQGAALQRESLGSKIDESSISDEWKPVFKHLSGKYGSKKAFEAIKSAGGLKKSLADLTLGIESAIVDLHSLGLTLQTLIKSGESDVSDLPVIAMKDSPNIKYRILGEDPNFYYLRHPKDVDNKHGLMKVRKNAIAEHFDLSGLRHKPTLTTPDLAVAPYTQSPEQLDLLNGINISSKTRPPGHYREGLSTNYPDKPYWTRNAKGKAVYIKHNIPGALPNQVEDEAIYNNIGRKYFGLGEHLSIVAVFKHPITGNHTLAVEGIPHSEHLRKFHDPEKGSDTPVLDHIESLSHNGAKGNLDKIFLADYILGKKDRTNMNMLFNQKDPSKLHIIDNSMLFEPTKQLETHGVYPKYAALYDKVNPHFHSETANWFRNLDFPSMLNELAQNGVTHEELLGTMARYKNSLDALSNPKSQRKHLWTGHPNG